MTFYTDKQTIKDLNITGKYNKHSIFSIYNKTVTRGGEKALVRMFASPFTQSDDIKKRIEKFRFFMESGVDFPLTHHEFQSAEDYLVNAAPKGFISLLFQNIKRKALKLIANEKEFDLLQDGFKSAAFFLSKMQYFISELDRFKIDGYAEEKEQISIVTGDERVQSIVKKIEKGKELSFFEFCRCDYCLRNIRATEMGQLLKLVHNLDVYTSVAGVAHEKKMALASIIEPTKEKISDENTFLINIKDVFHPGLKNAKINDICMSNIENLFFLTGANMAGKSTLMKSFAIAVYLAHMGFPVAASKMDFTPMQGVYTSINVPDNLNMGYSHFYAEVMRVKMIAGEIAAGKRLVVLFDEMFKGTNVKDAYDATVCISECFTRNRQCAFVVSTHIMEAGLTLQKKCGGIQYRYLPTLLKKGKPFYSYALQEGISDDHLGMLIVNNEKIIEIIKQSPEYVETT